MAKAKQENLPTRVMPGANVPSYLQDYEGFAEDMAIQKASLSEYVVLARMKIIQSMSAQELTSAFGVGSVILAPGNATVGKVRDDKTGCEPFTFTALFHYTEFCKWRDLQDKTSPSILESSFDRTGPLAQIARDPNKRVEPYGEVDARTKQPKFNYRYVEHLNFLGIIQGDHPLANQPCAISFSKGEFNTGRNFITAVTMRRTPIWSQVWEFGTVFNSRDVKKWWGWKFSPAETPDISADQVQVFREQYMQMKEAFEEKRLSVNHTDTDPEPGEDGPGVKAPY